MGATGWRRRWAPAAGQLAYYGGQRLGAMQLGGNTAMSLLVIAVEWALVTPALVCLSEVGSLDGLKR